jgi:hypothetical protein
LADLETQPVDSGLRIEHERGSVYSEWPFCRSQSVVKLFLALVFEAKSTNFALLGVENQVFEVALLTERSSYVFEVVWALQIVSLQKAVSSRRTLSSVANFIVIQVNGLQAHYGIVLVDPNVDADDERLSLGSELRCIFED